MRFNQQKISIVMAVYNGSDLLDQTLKSIGKQTYSNWELIIVDDGSNNSTVELIKKYMKKNSRIKLIRQSNQGQTKALNTGLKQVSGEFVARIDADDIMLPTRLDKQVKFLNEHPEIGLVGSSVNYCDESNKHFFILTPPTTHNELVSQLIRRNPFVHSSIMFRSKILDKVGLYNTRLKAAQDYDYWMRISQKFRVANIPEILVTIRKHDSNISAKYYRRQAIGSLKTQAYAIVMGWYSPLTAIYMLRFLFHLFLPKMIHDKWLSIRKQRQMKSKSARF